MRDAKQKTKQILQSLRDADDDDDNDIEDMYNPSQAEEIDEEDENIDEFLSDPDDLALVKLAQDRKALKSSLHIVSTYILTHGFPCV